jgi:ComEC/Rec2-related protein
VNAFRWSLSRRIVERLGPLEGGVAAAMTTGHEAWLSRETLDAMRDSGLAHVLSISGLHMAVVGGFVFFAVRALLAAWPWVAVRTDIKKAAALCGLVAVGSYLVVSGAPPPAERAAITASVAFLAVLLDRRAITLRALAIAALIVLALHPEAIVQPGFQMSFAATTALIALAERWPKPTREINAPWPIVAVQRAGAWIALSAAVSLVAGSPQGRSPSSTSTGWRRTGWRRTCSPRRCRAWSSCRRWPWAPRWSWWAWADPSWRRPAGGSGPCCGWRRRSPPGQEPFARYRAPRLQPFRSPSWGCSGYASGRGGSAGWALRSRRRCCSGRGRSRPSAGSRRAVRTPGWCAPGAWPS